LQGLQRAGDLCRSSVGLGPLTKAQDDQVSGRITQSRSSGPHRQVQTDAAAPQASLGLLMFRPTAGYLPHVGDLRHGIALSGNVGGSHQAKREHPLDCKKRHAGYISAAVTPPKEGAD